MCPTREWTMSSRDTTWALVSPKDITRYSYNLYLMDTANFGISSAFILIQLYPDWKDHDTLRGEGGWVRCSKN